MILIVDSGSTKTDWIAIENTGKVLFETQTLGLNPQVLSNNILKERIVNNFELYKFSLMLGILGLNALLLSTFKSQKLKRVKVKK